MITLVTGKKNSGKSTYLLNWYLKNPQGCGFLTVKRFKKNIHEGYDLLFLPSFERVSLCTRIPISATKPLLNNNELIQGNYIFNTNIFDSVSAFLSQKLSSNETCIFWLDEIGILEMNNCGFASLFHQFKYFHGDLRIGVRLSCIYDFIHTVGFSTFHIIYVTNE